MVESKIIFTGPVGVGKTTAISAISDEPPIKTDAHASDMTLARKDHTTVAMDYGVIHLDEETNFHLYGTPGHERFDFMWEILSTGALGLVLMLDNTRPTPLKDLEFFLDAFKDLLAYAPVVIGVTKMDIQASPTIAVYQHYLADKKLNIPVFEVDGREPNDVKHLVVALLFSIDPGLEV